MKQLVVGILAHVDAGKTTLSEGMLYTCGSIRKLGRVDRKDAFLDTYSQERERGITIFSKQAMLTMGDTSITLLDTPGHVDFSAEMERTLQVLDYAILVISGSDGVQGHTHTLWKLLKRYEIPVFLFVNKMDQPGTDQKVLLSNLKEQLGEGCIDFTDRETEQFFEEIAVCEEEGLNEFLESGRVSQDTIRYLISKRKVYPCFFGSALRLFGVEELLKGLDEFTLEQCYPDVFGARVFKITRDAQGNRLTHMKITGGSLRARENLDGTDRRKENWEEKVNQIRIYSGEKFETVNEVKAGSICAVTGLTKSWSGEGIGFEEQVIHPILEPVMSYRMILPEGCDAATMLPKLRQLEEEEPQLHILWDEQNKELKAQLMGQVQMEILKNLIQERFGVPVELGTGTIVYKETIANVVEGVGHFEPLRHYAEVHLLLEPGEPGSGIMIHSSCSTDMLDLNWQRLVMTHLEEREHPGVLTGSPITDLKITLVSGRAHQKHTEGGDFRQATYRALRQGLMQAESILLEPWYEFCLSLPRETVGRAMTDLEKQKAEFELEQSEDGMAVLRGIAPMSEMQDYQREVMAYTRGRGQLTCSLKGYFPCHNTEEVLAVHPYDPEHDTENPSGSVFCAHGAGFIVEWDHVPEYMHLESALAGNARPESDCPETIWKDGSGRVQGVRPKEAGRKKHSDLWLGTEEIDSILRSASHANRKEDRNTGREGWKRRGSRETTYPEQETRVFRPAEKKEQYLLVDGYNVIFAWEELKELAQINLDGARGKLLDILCNYQAVKKCNLIAVFDAYRLEGHQTEVLDYHNVHVVYTKEAETADRYIERFAHENAKKYDVTVVTSDGLEQIIIVGEGCHLVSSREFEKEVALAARRVLEEFQSGNHEGSRSLQYVLSEEKAGDSATSAPRTDRLP